MEQLRPRLLKTYSGLRGRQGRGGGGRRQGLGLRVLPAPALWISPQVDPKRFFSTSSSGGGSSFEDPDFLPRKRKEAPKKQLPRRQKGRKRKAPKRGAKENKAPQSHNNNNNNSSSSDSVEADRCVPPTPLRRNVTHRRRRRLTGPLLAPTPLLCSTPEPPAPLTPLRAEGGDPLEGEGDASPVSGLLFSSGGSRRAEVLRGDWPYEDALPELSLLKMNWEDEPSRAGGCSEERFGRKDFESCLRKGSRREPPSALSTPFQRRSAARPRASDRDKASSRHWEDTVSSPVRGGTNSDQKSFVSQTSDTSPLKGVLQLEAMVCDDKLVLSLPRDHHAPHTNKRQRVSVPPLKTTLAGLNGSLLEEQSNGGIDRNSPQFQPIVLLDNQVVPSWLANKSSEKQTAGHHAQKTENSPCNLSTISDIRSNNQVVPICGTGPTGRKACISGSSSSRWGQRRKPEEPRCKKQLGWKYKAEASLLQKSLRNQVEDNMSSSFLSPDSSFKNSALWRRIRASFSLHKKKKILSESESSNNSVGTSSSFRTRVTDSPKTPFTRTLGYSICPSSSMVLLLSMTSFSTLEVTLTDAEKVYGECHQKGPISFGECIPPEKMQKCEKIGEGVFGEVFRTKGEQGPVALKIIPIEGSERVNGEPQKTFSEILPEIIISKELSLLADEKVNQTLGFIQLYSVHCVQGAYPEPLLNAWDKYHRLRNSENDRPDFFGDQQLFMVLEFEYGGTDLENMRNRQLSSLATAKSILHQITASLAVAEESLRFEHRDLHWGNVLVKRTDLKEVSVTLNGETHVFPTHGILVKVIDYTFSRLERDGLTVYCDLSTDEEVFQGRGDYQFDIYRRMREENLNNWADYFPHSNILWLHYLVDKLLKGVSYKNKPTTPSLKLLQKQLKHFSEEVLGFGSAADLLKGSSFFQ